ncbi:MAG: autotransporter-associated beta strand repeat-containing protein, partial [Thermoguttaceae bacterium]|nr:autotransporter-associated beta strand repeat-containing protein [Thermoguttaceae bacterium]
GSLLVKGNMRIGKANTDSSDVSSYIGGKVINLNGGTIQNNNNNLTIKNDLNVMSETGFKTGWSKKITLTGNVTGSAKLKQVSDSGWLILKTHSDGDAFTGPFQTGWASTSKRGQTRLAAEQPLGANAGILYNYGYLDMNGFSQKFKGVVDDGANNKLGRIYNTTGTKSVVTFDITSQNLSYAGTIESNVELIVNASGEGVQTFTNGGSSFTGNATINGGKIRMTGKGSNGNSPIGKVSNTRYVYVNDGGELVFANQDVLANAHNYAPINFVVNGGKISNDGAFYNFLQNTTFKNGGQLYASDGNATWKAFKLLNVTVARNDDDTVGAPVLFSADSSKPDATIAFGDISDVIKAGNSVSTVNVAEITSANAAVNDNVSDLVISAVIADPVYQTTDALKHSTQIIKSGAGTMELTAANTITGKTTISEGAIKLSDSGTLGSGAVENNGTLEFAHESEQTFSNAISGTGDVVKSGSGTLTISNNNYSYTGETTVSGGTLLVTSAGSLSTSKVTVASTSGAIFQTGADLNGVEFELGQGGTFVIGESSASKDITIGALTL